MAKTTDRSTGGSAMRAEAAEAAAVAARRLRAAPPQIGPPPQNFYTIARGSSDAVATILAYEFMSVLERPVTSLPPSVFSLSRGVEMTGALAIVVSQSGESEDLVSCARGVRDRGGRVIALTNAASSALAEAADLVLDIGAGPERAVPATKTVVGSIAGGMSFLAALAPAYGRECADAAAVFETLKPAETLLANEDRLHALLAARPSVFVIGRGSGLGAAQEVALKLKETAAIHAEAHSAAEVLHGPLQLGQGPLAAVILDTGEQRMAESLDTAERRLAGTGTEVVRLRAGALSSTPLCPPAAAALLLCALYPVILKTSLSLGFDPDRPEALAKVTSTR